MEILNYAEGTPGKSTVATFSVYIPAVHLTIHRFRLVRTKTGKLIIGYPSYCSQQPGPSGKPSYAPYFEFSKEKGQEFDRKVLEALGPFMRVS